ncbi:SpoIIE family protein phosphatase [Mucilaginibacter sp. UR6-11]|uniref:SpoIIE family protein phosphatase n=1 Tax=Mucilaginibacter sp. UR6-11 TaxID=1435644 RepID=UPI001E4E94C3|nr:SpoIIE family protein phosphatase [Mucilaginibacter sp. UR6-11]MCC8425416.1 SpoIIE family protein phosphatase [Mucilaginibacter sp. UR6-11]
MAIHKPKHIMLVDDDQLFLKLIEQVFKKSGFNCTIAPSAEAAIELLKEGAAPDIILSDYEMLKMNGFEFRRYLMNEPLFKDIPFVFLTFFSDKDLVEKGLDLQAIDYIIKDTPINVIVSKVNNILFAVDKQRELSENEIKKAAKSLNIKSIPVKPPEIKEFKVDFWHQAYQDIPGGDFIDFIKVNDRYSFIVLGDIMGKKWMAWFFTFGFLSYVRSAVRFAAFNKEYSTSKILQQVNSIICFDEVLKDILSSLSLLLIDSETKRITYSGAGDLPLLHYNHEAGDLSMISSSGLLLGLFEEGNYSEKEIILKPGDRLFVFTDGMIDFIDKTGKKSDYNQFLKTLNPFMRKENNFTDIAANLFSNNLSEQVDDRSIISIYKN